MNIFILDSDPKISAQYLHDAHVRKMCTEKAQILSTVLLRSGNKAPCEKAKPENHPAILWAEKTCENFEWTLKYGFEICSEYTRRYGKVHASFLHLLKIQESHYRPAKKELQVFGQFIPDVYRQSDSIEAYRNMYVGEKLAFGRYTSPAEPPVWMWEKLLPTFASPVGEIFHDKIKISHIFLSDLLLKLEKKKLSKIKQPSLEGLFLEFGFGTSSDLPLPKREAGKLLSSSEKKFYHFQFLLDYLCEWQFLPGWSLITGKNARLKFQELK